ncbi:MAG: GAF domain-containing protein [Archangiaceae bacterium]|nr:GAF domain-containing protein [Archangiaceae bacterium]
MDGFTHLLEQLPLGVVEATPEGALSFMNENARLLLAGPPGAEVREVLTRLARGAWATQDCIEHALALGRLGEVRLWASPSRGKEGVTIILERHVAARTRLEAKLMSLLVKSATGVELWQASAMRALETLCASLPGSHMVLYELEGQHLVPTAHAALSPGLAAALRPLSNHPSELVGRVATSGRMMALSPIAQSPLVLPFAYPLAGALAAIAVPLMGSSGVRGVFYACGPESVLSESEARLLLMLAEMLGLLLEQKNRDERIVAERDRYGSLLHNLPDAVLELGVGGAVQLAGGGTQEVFGLDPELVVGRAWHEWLSEEDRARVETAQGPIDVKVRCAHGVVRTCSVAGHIASDGVKRLVFRDMTAQLKLRSDAHSAMEAAARNERLAILGRLTAGVGHELNNPLSYLTANLGSLREELDDVDTSVPAASLKEMRSIIDDCEEGVRRLVSIVQALKGSSKPEGAAGSPTTVFDPAHAVSNAVTLFKGVNRHKVNVEWDVRSLPLVQGSVGALSQVVLNLLQNGMEAMGGKGKLVVSGAVHAEEGKVLVEVADEGRGIPEAVRARVFEPFFTTKTDGSGNGLGLFLCQQLLAGMGGTLEFRTGDSGTTFIAKLPMAAEEREGEDVSVS